MTVRRLTRADEKRSTFLTMLDKGMTMLHLDARAPGVDVPANLSDQSHLRLNFSYKFQLPIFDIGRTLVRAALSFGGKDYVCVIPWEAVFGMTHHSSGDYKLWPEDMPEEMWAQAAAMAEELGEARSDDAPVRAEPPEEEEVGPAVRRVGHLRVIK